MAGSRTNASASITVDTTKSIANVNQLTDAVKKLQAAFKELESSAIDLQKVMTATFDKQNGPFGGLFKFGGRGGTSTSGPQTGGQNMAYMLDILFNKGPGWYTKTPKWISDTPKWAQAHRTGAGIGGRGRGRGRGRGTGGGGGGGGGGSGRRRGGGGGGGGRQPFMRWGYDDPVYRIVDALAWIIPAKGEQVFGMMKGGQTLGLTPRVAALSSASILAIVAAVAAQGMLASDISKTMGGVTQVGTGSSAPTGGGTGFSVGGFLNPLLMSAAQHFLAAQTGVSSEKQNQILGMFGQAGRYGTDPQSYSQTIDYVASAMDNLGMTTQDTAQLLKDSLGNLGMTVDQTDNFLRSMALEAAATGTSPARISKTAADANLLSALGGQGATQLSGYINTTFKSADTADFMTKLLGNQITPVGSYPSIPEMAKAFLYNAGTGQNLSFAQVQAMETTPEGMAQLAKGMSGAFAPGKLPPGLLDRYLAYAGVSLPRTSSGDIDTAALRGIAAAANASTAIAALQPDIEKIPRTKMNKGLLNLALGLPADAVTFNNPPQVPSQAANLAAGIAEAGLGDLQNWKEDTGLSALQRIEDITTSGVSKFVAATILGPLLAAPAAAVAAGVATEQIIRIVIETNGNVVTTQDIPVPQPNNPLSGNVAYRGQPGPYGGSSYTQVGSSTGATR